VAGSLKKDAFLVEVEGELRYREFLLQDSERKMRIAEVHVISILTLDRAENTHPDGISVEGFSAPGIHLQRIEIHRSCPPFFMTTGFAGRAFS
jgi:hypothetical protein